MFDVSGLTRVDVMRKEEEYETTDEGRGLRELTVSLSTLDRRIASGEIQVRREQHGRRHRVYVMLDDDLPVNGVIARSQGTLLDVARSGLGGWTSRWRSFKPSLHWSRSGTWGWRRSVGRSVESATG